MSIDLERVRDYVEDRLKPAEREAFAREIARDPSLAELVETYDLVARATADRAPATTTSYGDVMLRARTARRLPRPLLAAAALLVAVGIYAGVRATRAPGAVTLTSIPLALLPAPEAPPEWPRELLDHETADEEGLLFHTDMAKALAVARAAGTRVFLFIHFPGCPWCDEFRTVQCRDEGLAKAALPYVLLSLDWRKAPEALQSDPREGWPIFDVLDADGQRVDGFTGMRPAATIAAWLDERAPPRPDWEGLGEGARRLDEAERAEDPARRFELYRQVAAADNVLGQAARARLAGMAKEAQKALFAARDDAHRLGPEAAADRLGAAALALRGTPYAADLESVLAFVRKHGSFPDLRE